VPARVPGVSFLHLFASSLGSYPVFYAGKTLDIRRRLTGHLSDQKCKPSIGHLRRNRRAYFSAAPVLDAELRERVEAGLILCLVPPCNDQLPTAPTVFVNLPPLRLKGDSQ
jgi:hypothetical protein